MHDKPSWNAGQAGSAWLDDSELALSYVLERTGKTGVLERTGKTGVGLDRRRAGGLGSVRAG